jgi:hypothetical protein
MRVFNQIVKVRYFVESKEVIINDDKIRFRSPMYLDPKNEEQKTVLDIILSSNKIKFRDMTYFIIEKFVDFDMSELIIELSTHTTVR